MSKNIVDVFNHLKTVLDGDSAAAFKIIRELSTVAGGERITIPSHNTLDISVRRLHIQSYYDAKQYTVSDLARVFGISESQVKKDLNTPSRFGENIEGGE